MMVVCFDSRGAVDRSNKFKLSTRRMGPYLVTEKNEKGTYTLTELDGAQLAGTSAAIRIKGFHPRPTGEVANLAEKEMGWMPSGEEEEEEDGEAED